LHEAFPLDTPIETRKSALRFSIRFTMPATSRFANAEQTWS
jgi:hypothetical protein